MLISIRDRGWVMHFGNDGNVWKCLEMLGQRLISFSYSFDVIEHQNEFVDLRRNCRNFSSIRKQRGCHVCKRKKVGGSYTNMISHLFSSDL